MTSLEGPTLPFPLYCTEENRREGGRVEVGHGGCPIWDDLRSRRSFDYLRWTFTRRGLRVSSRRLVLYDDFCPSESWVGTRRVGQR